MGMDTDAAGASGVLELSQGDSYTFKDADISLCGGLFSGRKGSFRGKVYASYVLEIAGESLYETWLLPEMVRNTVPAVAAYKRLPQQILDLSFNAI